MHKYPESGSDTPGLKTMSAVSLSTFIRCTAKARISCNANATADPRGLSFDINLLHMQTPPPVEETFRHLPRKRISPQGSQENSKWKISIVEPIFLGELHRTAIIYSLLPLYFTQKRKEFRNERYPSLTLSLSLPVGKWIFNVISRNEKTGNNSGRL